MRRFAPDYHHILQAARNVRPQRTPLYEHIISELIMETVLNTPFAALEKGDEGDKREYMTQYVRFFEQTGYDTVSFERLITAIMPDSGALYAHRPGAIRTRQDFEKYPWKDLPDAFFSAYSTDYHLLRELMPPGMKAIGGPGNGVFECVQDLVGYEPLCYIAVDDPELYSDLFDAVGRVMSAIWERFLDEFGDIYSVCRFGDDLGFKSSTLLDPDHIRTHMIPQYRRIIQLVHSHGKPFLLHSCGNIFSVMEDLIEKGGIDAKHSNEDAIAPFSVWVERYGDRIGNFGGIDTDILCQKSEAEIRRYVSRIYSQSRDRGGFALGSGNSIPDYVPVDGYMAMVDETRKLRGE